MSNTIVSANMNMPIPVPTVDPGPDYALNLNSCLATIDSHNHSVGNGVQVTPSGLLMNANLPFIGNTGPTNIYAATFQSQISALSGLNFLSFIGGNLYVNDGSGNQIQMTSAGGVAGSPGSIGSLASPAAATYSAGNKQFSWTASSNHFAAMANGAVSIAQTNVASSFAVTLACNASITGNYQLTLPASLPTSTKYLLVDSSGNMGTSSADTIFSPVTVSLFAAFSGGTQSGTTCNALQVQVGKMVMVSGTVSWTQATSTGNTVVLAPNIANVSSGAGSAWLSTNGHDFGSVAFRIDTGAGFVISNPGTSPFQLGFNIVYFTASYITS